MREPTPKSNWLSRLFGRIWHRPSQDFGPRRGSVTHVIILDGTLSSLVPECRTNAARAYGLVQQMGSSVSIYYEPGVQWQNWRSAIDVLMGRGINAQIKRAYGYLASRYRSGDRVFLIGYSRGAYAVRSLAGVIDMVGLLRPDVATERNIRDAYRHYENAPGSDASRAFSRQNCHDRIEIDAIGIWDTVKSLGINAPILWRLSEHLHAFHNHELSNTVKNGFHALAHDENRVAYGPVLWTTNAEFEGRVEQVWFPGAHSDVGGQLDGFETARPLANIPLVWILSRLEAVGLPLPEGWQAGLDQDIYAPARGTWRGAGRFLMTRKKRVIGVDPSERIHESVRAREDAQKPSVFRGLVAR